MGRVTTRAKSIDNLGNVAGSDVLAGYKPIQRDENPGGVSYYGMIASDGSWVILRDSVSGTVTTNDYAIGTSNFSTNWADRVTLTYSSFDTLF